MSGADVVVIGAGLAGLVAATEAAAAGRTVVVVDQEPGASLGGQAYWSLGGLFLVDSPEQRRVGITDSLDLARQDWAATAAFDRVEDHWPRRWSEAFLDFAAGDLRAWLRQAGIALFPLPMWAERGGLAGGPGNSVPRFHVVWGSGPGVVTPFVRTVTAHARAGRIRVLFRHRVTGLTGAGGAVTGVSGEVLAPDDAVRGAPSSRRVVGDFRIDADAVVIASGGIGANHDLVRQFWPGGPAAAPARMLSGVPDSTDGLMLGVAASSGASLINRDRMWHYPEGITNHSPVWSHHGIRILSGPSPLWLDSAGRRLPPPLWPGFDTGGSLRHLTDGAAADRATDPATDRAADHSWFVTDLATITKEFGLSGSEQNPDFTGRSVRALLRRVVGSGPARPVQAFLDDGSDFVTADGPDALVARMNELTGADLLDAAVVGDHLRQHDAQVRSGLGKDGQLAAVLAARRYVGDRRMRTADPHELLSGAGGPLVGVRLHVLTRKTLGGLETDLDGRVLRPGGAVLPGLYAAGEATGFGGGGMHGWKALEGTFLAGCLFSGRVAGRSAAALI
ncbi:FAD-binding dehydrogenase [Nakamurella sp. YIM 132084]|uniref:FAD-binding dehydrogenase n=1 Tax=Nakamurella leprariae TaxID=2803911 RepID=A0A939C0S7_9ACTN|nr:FAD-binding dehydrogenase [Nakamurella leprariae]